jgi:two-component system cell cycle response regulator DivK
MPELKRVTVVNDSPEFLQLMQDLLQDASYPATLIDGDRDNAFDLIKASQPEILIVDLRLGSNELRGLDILKRVRDDDELRRVPTVICTADAWGMDRAREEVAAIENVAVLTKPFAIADLHRVLRELGAAAAE